MIILITYLKKGFVGVFRPGKLLDMKVLIWIGCIFVTSFVIVALRFAGIYLGAIPTLIVYAIMFWIASSLCKSYDEKHPSSNKASEQKKVTPSNGEVGRKLPSTEQKTQSVPTNESSRNYRATTDDKRIFVAAPRLDSVSTRSSAHLENQKTESLAEDQILFCHKCGSKLLPDSIFCSNCGVKIR